jgi:hypothetical protein
VSGFSPELGKHNRIPVATVGSLWVNPAYGQHYILILNEALYFGDELDHSLINPNQIRSYLGDVIQDNPFDKRSMGIRVEGIEIPFVTKGTTIYYESTKPSRDDLERYPQIVLTSDAPWSLSAIQLSTDDMRVVRSIRTSRHDHDKHETDYVLEGNFGMTEQIFYKRIILRVYAIPEELNKKFEIQDKPGDYFKRRKCSIEEMRSNDRHSKITPEHIAKVFDISQTISVCQII